MAPTKARVLPDDARSEASSTKDRIANLSHVGNNGKARRGGSNLVNTAHQKESVNTSIPTALAASGSTQDTSTAGQPSIQWPTLDSSTLHAYRHAYRLNTPSSFANSYDQLILSQPGIGRHSPTMARRKDHRKQSKDQLATVVRKHFNGMGITENDAIVEFLYKVKHQDKAFRLRFTPQRSR